MNDGRCDVVWQISRDSCGAPLRQIGLKHIGTVQMKCRVGAEFALQTIRQPIVQLDRVQFARPRKQISS